jgi:hypothetical protein
VATDGLLDAVEEVALRRPSTSSLRSRSRTRGRSLRIGTLPLEKSQDGKHRWRKLADVSVVATDLKSSTAVSYSLDDQT